MILTMVVPDPPPIRTHPGRSADRDSPNAGPLVQAAEALLRAEPNTFPRVFSEIRVVFGKTLPEVDPVGYQPDDPIYEVLQDVGVVIEPDSWTSRNEQDPTADVFVVTFELENQRWEKPT
jgi:hypothetical protein